MKNLNKFFVAAIFSFLILSIVNSPTISAMTSIEKEALINTIKQQIVVLQQKIAQILAEQQGTNTWCHNFNTSLGYADSGTSEVSNLHLALIQEGISYTPDDIKTYSSATSTAIKQFQAKYGISPVSGFTGIKTRTKLNQLYGCKSASSQEITIEENTDTNVDTDINTEETICTPNWSCGEWSQCVNGQQTNSCIDNNQCITVNRTETQTCTLSCTPNWSCGEWSQCLNNQQARSCTDLSTCNLEANNNRTETQACSVIPKVSLKINNVDGPIAIMAGNSVTLSWTAENTFYCTASSTNLGEWIDPTYSASGSVTKVVSSPNMFTLRCITRDGQTATDSVTVNVNVSTACTPVWDCGDWGTCVNNQQVKVCTDRNGCGTTLNRPAISQSCTMPTIAPLPTLDLKVNDQNGPINVAYGSQMIIKYTTKDTINCRQSDDLGIVTENTSVRPSWSFNLPVDFTVSKKYTMICQNSKGETTSDSVVVNVDPTTIWVRHEGGNIVGFYGTHNPYELGYLTYKGKDYNDECINSGDLKQYLSVDTALSTPKSTNYLCLIGCSGGKCRSEITVYRPGAVNKPVSIVGRNYEVLWEAVGVSSNVNVYLISQSDTDKRVLASNVKASGACSAGMRDCLRGTLQLFFPGDLDASKLYRVVVESVDGKVKGESYYFPVTLPGPKVSFWLNSSANSSTGLLQHIFATWSTTSENSINLSSTTAFRTFGDTVVLNWTSPDATSCTASGNWSGAKSPTGSEEFKPYASYSSYISSNATEANIYTPGITSYIPPKTYTLTCTNASGHQTLVNIIWAPAIGGTTNSLQRPLAYLKISPGSSTNYTNGPLTINKGDPITLQWTTYNASSCSLLGSVPVQYDYFSYVLPGIGGSIQSGGTKYIASVNPSESTATFLLKCKATLNGLLSSYDYDAVSAVMVNAR